MRWHRLSALAVILASGAAEAVPLRGQMINPDGFTLTFTGGGTLQVIGTTSGNVFTVQMILNGQPNAGNLCQGTTGSCQQSFQPVPSANAIENFRPDIQARIDATGLGAGWNWRVCTVTPLAVVIVTGIDATSTGTVPPCS